MASSFTPSNFKNFQPKKSEIRIPDSTVLKLQTTGLKTLRIPFENAAAVPF